MNSYFHPALNSSVRPLGLHAAGHDVGTTTVQPFGRARRGVQIGSHVGSASGASSGACGDDGQMNGGGAPVSHPGKVVNLASSASTGLLLERGGRLQPGRGQSSMHGSQMAHRCPASTYSATRQGEMREMQRLGGGGRGDAAAFGGRAEGVTLRDERLRRKAALRGSYSSPIV